MFNWWPPLSSCATPETNAGTWPFKVFKPPVTWEEPAANWLPPLASRLTPLTKVGICEPAALIPLLNWLIPPAKAPVPALIWLLPAANWPILDWRVGVCLSSIAKLELNSWEPLTNFLTSFEFLLVWLARLLAPLSNWATPSVNSEAEPANSPTLPATVFEPDERACKLVVTSCEPAANFFKVAANCFMSSLLPVNSFAPAANFWKEAVNDVTCLLISACLLAKSFNFVTWPWTSVIFFWIDAILFVSTVCEVVLFWLPLATPAKAFFALAASSALNPAPSILELMVAWETPPLVLVVVLLEFAKLPTSDLISESWLLMDCAALPPFVCPAVALFNATNCVWIEAICCFKAAACLLMSFALTWSATWPSPVEILPLASANCLELFAMSAIPLCKALMLFGISLVSLANLATPPCNWPAPADTPSVYCLTPALKAPAPLDNCLMPPTNWPVFALSSCTPSLSW